MRLSRYFSLLLLTAVCWAQGHGSIAGSGAISGAGSGSIIVAPGVVINTVTLPAATATVLYNQTLFASGGNPPYTWSVYSGALPGGMTLNSSTGVVNGTSSSVNTYAFTVKVIDSSAPALSATQPLSIVVQTATCGPPTYPCSRTDNLLAVPAAVPPQMGANTCTAGVLYNCGNLLGIGNCQTPSDFGNQICRLTDASVNPRFANQTYVTTSSGSGDEQLFNCASPPTRITVDDISGPRTYPRVFTGTSSSPLYASNPAWSPTGGIFINYASFWGRNCPTDANVLFTLGNGQFGTAGARGTLLGSFDFTSTATVPSFNLIYDFSSSPNCLGASFGTVTWTANGGSDQSDTDFGFAFSNSGGQGGVGAVYVAVYRVGSGCRVLNTQTGVVTGDWGPTGTVTGTTCRATTHNVKLFKSGGSTGTILWAIENPIPAGNCTDGNGNPYQWQYTGLSLTPICPTKCGGHWTEGIAYWANNNGASDSEYWINRNQNTPSTLIPIWGNYAAVQRMDDHAGWNGAVNSPQDTWPILNTTATHTPAVTGPWANEVVGISPAAGNPVWRFGHCWNTATSQRFSTHYCIASVSQDGNYALISSDWFYTLGSETGSPVCVPSGPLWAAGAAWAGGASLTPKGTAASTNAKGYSFVTLAGGTSGSVAPAAWNQTIGGSTVDGSVTWTNNGLANCRGDVFSVQLR
jgi:hypothetical protein